ncbi:hypothetical protein [Microbacterium ulmi]|uniref:Uncharacterized protein n=1 Tax=Microbacterium ulmi TaxID=179095 RepID=A0A7Y2Q374_9MICO|nr:hypothetical protein [Microbacterium ulmi]NII68540.1 hypothetical protein [Microbacterium ulmi]NNH05413.1 hypothetical protein [Microbacterium ulmi]
MFSVRAADTRSVEFPLIRPRRRRAMPVWLVPSATSSGWTAEPADLGDLLSRDAQTIVRVVHPPSGTVIDYPPGAAYDSVQQGDRDGTADGRPSEYGADWDASCAIRAVRAARVMDRGETGISMNGGP